ncbi:MAG: hypothetical protein ACOYEP_02820 [Limnochordia bacterium]|jgi:hypothetical protein
MRVLRNRFLWGALGLAAGAWSLYVLREKNEQKRVAMQSRRGLWRRSYTDGSRIQPKALDMAARAGRTMMDTTMRAMRAVGRR